MQNSVGGGNQNKYNHTLDLSGLVAGDLAICGRLAALIPRLRPDLRSADHLTFRVGLGLRFGLRPLRFESAAISQQFRSLS